MQPYNLGMYDCQQPAEHYKSSVWAWPTSVLGQEDCHMGQFWSCLSEGLCAGQVAGVPGAHRGPGTAAASCQGQSARKGCCRFCLRGTSVCTCTTHRQGMQASEVVAGAPVCSIGWLIASVAWRCHGCCRVLGRGRQRCFRCMLAVAATSAHGSLVSSAASHHSVRA